MFFFLKIIQVIENEKPKRHGQTHKTPIQTVINKHDNNVRGQRLIQN